MSLIGVPSSSNERCLALRTASSSALNVSWYQIAPAWGGAGAPAQDEAEDELRRSAVASHAQRTHAATNALELGMPHDYTTDAVKSARAKSVRMARGKNSVRVQRVIDP